MSYIHKEYCNSLRRLTSKWSFLVWLILEAKIKHYLKLKLWSSFVYHRYQNNNISTRFCNRNWKTFKFMWYHCSFHESTSPLNNHFLCKHTFTFLVISQGVLRYSIADEMLDTDSRTDSAMCPNRKLILRPWIYGLKVMELGEKIIPRRGSCDGRHRFWPAFGSPPTRIPTNALKIGVHRKVICHSVLAVVINDAAAGLLLFN